MQHLETFAFHTQLRLEEHLKTVLNNVNKTIGLI